MLLLYDHKCNLCRNLAYKIHISTNKKVEIKSLSDPEAVEILTRFYPSGWSHDFYVIEGNACRKGIRALVKLLKPLGPKGMAALLSEYSAFKLARAANTPTANQHQPTRRSMLKYAALAPVVTGLSKFSLADPFKSADDDFRVHIARVTAGETQNGWVTDAWRCVDCIQPTPQFKQGSMDIQQSVQQTVLQDMNAALPLDGGVKSNLRVVKTVLSADIVKDGAPIHQVMDIYAAILDHPRFKVTFNVGNGPVTTTSGFLPQATTISVMINHDLPTANVDLIAFESSYELNYEHYPEAYAAGIRSLGKLHRQNGDKALTQLYEGIAQSMTLLKTELGKVVPDSFVPIHSKGIVTSLPELMRFVAPPSTVKFGSAITGGCDAGCSCSCSACCGCSCSVGIGACIPPLPPCGCGCCASCGCGCGACCGFST